jgi:hypothetical protein
MLRVAAPEHGQHVARQQRVLLVVLLVAVMLAPRGAAPRRARAGRRRRGGRLRLRLRRGRHWDHARRQLLLLQAGHRHHALRQARRRHEARRHVGLGQQPQRALQLGRGEGRGARQLLPLRPGLQRRRAAVAQLVLLVAAALLQLPSARPLPVLPHRARRIGLVHRELAAPEAGAGVARLPCGARRQAAAALQLGR